MTPYENVILMSTPVDSEVNICNKMAFEIMCQYILYVNKGTFILMQPYDYFVIIRTTLDRLLNLDYF